MAYRNVVDDSSTSVSAATPGWTVDLRNHTTARLRSQGVPCRFKVCVNSTVGNDTGAIKLVDSTGSTVLTCLINNPAATSSSIGDWYWVDGYVPATLAKYDVHYGGNTLGTLTPLSASLYEIDWTTDPVTGAASLTLGALTIAADGNTTNTGVAAPTLDALTVSADGGFRGDASLTLGALTTSAAGTVDVIGSSSMTLGAMTIAADGTVATLSMPTYQASGSADSQDGGGSNSSPAWPTHAVGDVALCIVSQYNASSTDPGAATLVTANGFVQVTGATKLSSTGVHRVRSTVFWCRATSTSMSAPTVQGISGCSLIAQIVTVRGCVASGDPWDVVSTSANNASDTSLVATGATTTGSERLVIAVISGSANATMSAWANSDLSSVTEIADSLLPFGFTSPTSIHVGAASGGKSASGAYGNTTATISTSDVWAAVTIALKP